ncbi:type II toxin-antitoxin system death-on-curing family toxin [Flavihumibacter sp. ZG627]|uniref:type II toxin-antitoxin system death-on-curing family toxin n=1 Tax=Flavihumibacter sp. ZG627 TaxID=1463156 RepID=UPI00057C4D21|nr:type II toxin-antitoxin system death-on-curing family toxin [Flavihumibacter sp. ZG627]KIC91273.1 death-on-curing protein [Flavihumibacter sp. ZG627]
MISITEVEHLHKLLIDRFGGSHGVRDRAALESAVARPFQTFDDKDLYPSVIEKAASLIESILINHPFIDGNKRTGYLILRLFLISNDLDIAASQENKYELVINIASGTLKFQGIVAWLESNTIKRHEN